MRKTIITIIAGFIIAITSPFIAIAANDTPHNASKTVSCGNCHGKALVYSPFWGGSYTPANIDDTVYNKICLECHTQPSGPYTTTGAPFARTHSSLATDAGYGNWTRECRDCHNPHYQKQSLFKRTDSSNLYLARGTVTSCVYNGDGTSTLGYSGITYKTGWDATKLLDKTGSYRRTMLVPNVGKLGYNYPVTAIDATAITVEGNATEAYQYISPPTIFAVMYGQYIKDLINVGGTNKTVKLLDRTGTKSFADGDTTYDGVCEVCHTQTTHFRNNGGGSDPNHVNIGGAGGTNCISCHTHPEGFKASCNACHGYPPIVNSATSPDGLVWILPVTGSATAGAHNLHVNTKGYTCIVCHYNNTVESNKHNTDPRYITLGFYMFSGAYQGGSYDGQASPNYNATTTTPPTTVSKLGAKKCSNLYCHGGTMAPNGGTAEAIWDNPASATCGTCHGVSAGSPPQRGSHTKHAGSGGLQLACTVCHSGYSSVHVNGSANWAYDTTTHTWLAGALYRGSASGSTSPVPSASYGTCSNLYCHGSGIPVWGGAALNCDGCHKASNVLAGKHGAHYATTTGATNRLAANNSSSTTYIYNCGTCHDSGATSHAGGPVSSIQAAQIAFDATYAGGGTYTADGTLAGTDNGFKWTNGTCSATYCHSPGTKNAAYDAPNITPTWNGTLDATCTGCHKGNAEATPDIMATNAHGSHVNDTGNEVGKNIGCAECHKATVSADRSLSSLSNHVNKLVNIKFDNSLNKDADGPTYNASSTTGANGATKTPGTAGYNCANVYCHSIGNLDSSGNVVAAGGASFRTIAWNGAAIGCDACHGDDPTNKAHPVYATGTPGSTTANSHVRHVENKTYSCDFCHNTTTTSTLIPPTTVVNGGAHLNRVETVSFKNIGSKGGTYNPVAKTCSTTYCHGIGTPIWGGTMSGNCTDCHGFPPSTNAHAAHIQDATLLTRAYGNTEVKSNAANYAFGCGNCHPLNVSSHVNEMVDIELYNPSATGQKKLNTTAQKTGSSGVTVCLDIYCHSDGKGVYANTPQWSSAFAGDKCAGCHGNSPSSNAHLAHAVAIHYDDIYNGTLNKVSATGTTGTGAGHGDPNVSRTISCNVCHNDTVTASYNRRNPVCSACHLADGSPAKGDESLVIADKSKHVNESINIKFALTGFKSRAQIRDSITTVTELNDSWTRTNGYKGGAASYDAAKSTPSYAGGTCSSVVCHNGNTVAWTAGAISCNACHTALPQAQ